LYIHRIMQTDHPTTTIYFLFALTVCGVKVYKSEQAFLLKMLEKNEKTPESYEEVDTRLVISIFRDAMKNIVEKQSELLTAVTEEATHMQEILSRTV